MEERVVSKLRVCVVGPASPPSGGMAAQTQQLCDLLRKEGIDVTFLQTNAPYTPSWVGRYPGFRALFRLATYCRSAWVLLGSADVVHLMSNSGWSWQLFSAPVLWISHIRHTPVIVNYRGGEADSYFSKSIGRVRPSLKKAAAIVVPSGYLKEVFSRYGFESIIIPNIVDVSKFHYVQNNFKFNSHDSNVAEPLNVISVRNLESIYDIEASIRAIKSLKDDGISVKLMVAGSGPEESFLKGLVKDLELSQEVQFLGSLSRKEIESLYSQADVLINSSRVDNMPNSLIEAMACGVPIVSTDAGGIPWMVEHEKTALLVKVGDFSGLAEEIKKLIKNPDLRQSMIETGVEKIQQYGWHKVKGEWLNVYGSLSRLQKETVLG